MKKIIMLFVLLMSYGCSNSSNIIEPDDKFKIIKEDIEQPIEYLRECHISGNIMLCKDLNVTNNNIPEYKQHISGSY